MRKAESDRILRTALLMAGAMRKVTMASFRKRPRIIVKEDQSPVTAADKDAEKAARAIVAKLHFDHGFFGEEFGRGQSRRFQWVVDPIDGTRSFATGCPTFASLIALAEDNEPRIGVLELSAMDERWYAGAFGPAWYQRGRGRPLRVRCSKIKRLKDASVAATSTLSGKRTIHPAGARLLYGGKTHRIGGDSINYGLLASGQLDVVFDVDMHPYDFMAMVPVIAAAGGCITDWQGRPLTADSGDKVVASATPELHREALGAIAGR